MTFPSGEAIEAEAGRGRRAEVVEVYGRQVRGHAVDGPWADALSDLDRPVADARRARRRRLGHGLAPGDARLAVVGRPSSTGTAGGSGCCSSSTGLEALGEEAWSEPARPRGRGDAARRGADAPLRRAFREPGHGLRATATCSASSSSARGPVDGEPCLGVYAEVLEPGMVRVGDEVEVL